MCNDVSMESLYEHAGGRECLRRSQVAVQNSHAQTDDQLHPLREVPKWQWP